MTLSRNVPKAELAWLRIAAYHDELTGLLNRRRLGVDLRRCMASPTPSMLVLFLDLDGFKRINDSHGHAMGDRVLRHVACLFREVVGHQGLVYRLGGDEFIAVLRSNDSDEAASTVEEVRRRLAEPTEALPMPQVSAGWALCPDDGSSLEALVAVADERMYKDKQSSHAMPTRSS